MYFFRCWWISFGCLFFLKWGWCAGQSMTQIWSSSNHLAALLEMCFGSLSCWNILSFSGISNFSKLFTTLCKVKLSHNDLTHSRFGGVKRTCQESLLWVRGVIEVRVVTCGKPYIVYDLKVHSNTDNNEILNSINYLVISMAMPTYP